MFDVVGFLVCALVIFISGRSLSRYGEKLAGMTGLGGAWVGLILMASVTSLPELTTGITSSAFLGSADLAVGDILGSCAFNLGILAMLDAFVPKRQPLLGNASANHIVSAAMGAVLLSMVGLAMVVPGDIEITRWLGVTSLAFIAVYLVSIRLVSLNERNHANTAKQGSAVDPKGSAESLRKVAGKYAIHAVVILGSASMLPRFADRIAEQTGLERSFIGTFFLAVSTSLPEVAVSITAIRMGAIDMAVGNLIGSNLFNVLILAIDDMFYTRGHILKDAASSHLISVFSTIIMTAVVICGLSLRLKGKRFLLAWDSAVIFVVYLLNLLLLFRLAD